MTGPNNAFTLPELLLAISITALIALSAAAVAVGLGHAQERTDSICESIQSARSGMMRADAAVRKARLVTALADGALCLWMGDANADKKINVDELVSLVLVPEARTVELRQVVFPVSMPDDTRRALNVDCPLADLTAVAAVLNLQLRPLYSGYLSRIVLSTDVQNFQAVADASPPMSRVVALRMTVGQPAQQIALANSAWLRCDATACVQMVQGVPVLDLN